VKTTQSAAGGRASYHVYGHQARDISSSSACEALQDICRAATVIDCSIPQR
jgi:hypothetical protein